MDCHNTEKDQKEITSQTKEKSHRQHLLMMILCCGLPVLVLALVPIITQVNPAFGGFLGGYAWLFCPLLMIPMLFMMFAGRKQDRP